MVENQLLNFIFGNRKQENTAADAFDWLNKQILNIYAAMKSLFCHKEQN